MKGIGTSYSTVDKFRKFLYDPSNLPRFKLSTWSKIGRFFVANPTLVTSLLYVYITGVGILSSWALYREFRINIFDYAEIGDFLLAALKSPNALYNLVWSLISLIIGILVALVLVPWIMRLYGRVVFRFIDTGGSDTIGRWDRWIDRGYVPWMAILGPIVSVMLLISLWVNLTIVSAHREAEAIKHGDKPLVAVQYRSFSSSTGQVTKSGIVLIGATQKVVFFYDIDDKQTLVIPQLQIVSIAVPE